MPSHLTPAQLELVNEELYACIDMFINYDTTSALLHTMNHLLNAFIEASDMDGSDKDVVTDVVCETIRMNAFFAELREKFEAVRYRYN